jgi:hypothetical protein
MARTASLVIGVYNDSMVDALHGTLRSFLRAGDEVDLVSGNHDHPLSVPTLDRWASGLQEALPAGVRFAAHTSGLNHAAEIATGGAPIFTSILLDYEPNWDPQFTWDFPATLHHFDKFSAICRARSRRAVAYPTGRPLRETALQRYRWDYGELRAHVDGVYPQTQHWATLGSPGWTAAVRRLRSEWSAHGVEPGDLTVQLTLGDRDNGLPAETAIMRYSEAWVLGIRRFYLWWAPSMLDAVTAFLRAIDV